LFVLLRLVRERLVGDAAPDELLGVGVVHVQYQGSDGIVLDLRGCFAEAAPSPSAHSVIKGLVLALISCATDGRESYISAIVDALPSFGLQVFVDGFLDSTFP